MGGTWGARLSDPGAKQNWKKSWEKILESDEAYSPRSSYGDDQALLELYVWYPWAHKDVIEHDSYNCRIYHNSIGFPTKRISGVNNFVGALTSERKRLWIKCPKACRRMGHEDWEYC